MAESSSVAQRTVFHGRVQGVGFRMTTVSIARRYEVTGFVRNMPDGTVEIVADGQPTEIERFLSEVESAFDGYVTGRDDSKTAIAEGLSAFEIRY